MHKNSHFFILSFPLSGVLSFCLLLTLGYFAGYLLAWIWSDILFSLMRCLLSAPVSIVGLILAFLLPLGLSAFAVYYNISWLPALILFSKAVLTGFCIKACVFSFGGAGWLVYVFILFLDNVMFSLTIHYCLLHQQKKNILQSADLLIRFLIGIVLFGLQFFVITPFVQHLAISP